MAKQRYEPWQIRDFSAGQVEKLNDNILPDAAAHECLNFISSRMGGLSKRKGFVTLNSTPMPGHVQGLHPYYARTTRVRKLIAMAQGIGWEWTGTTFEAIQYEGAESILEDLSFPLIGSVLFDEILFNHSDSVFPLDPSAQVLFEDAVNYVVGMNGIDKPWKWGGTYLTFLESAPAKGKFPILHKEKLFCVDADEPSTLRWSESFDPEDWPEINYWDIKKGDGDEITCLVKFIDELFVFKQRSLHTLKGTSLEDFSLQEVSANVGCVGPRAAVAHDLKIFFISERGIYVTNGLNVINISEMIIPDTWERVNKNYIHKSIAVEWEGLIWFVIPLDDSVYNNFVLVYDSKKQAFFPMNNIAGSCYAIYDDGLGDGVKLYSGRSQQGIVDIQAQTNDDNGEPIEAYWRGKFFDMGIPEVEKKSRDVYIQDSRDTDVIPEIAVCLDYEEKDGDLVYNNLTYYASTGLTRQFKLDYDENRWRYISPEIRHNSTGNCEIRGIVIPYKPKTRLAVREK